MSSKARRAPGLHSARGPGSYVVQACNVCRHKKIKCDGGKPHCETCIKSGRQTECIYGKEPPRRPRTEAHFQAMLRNIQALRDYIRILESHMEQCSKEHPGSTAHQYLSSRPDSLEEAPESPEEVVNEVVTEEEEEKGDNDVAKELCLPTQSLRLAEEGGLLLHGATAPFRYSSDPMPPRPSMPRLWVIAENEAYTLLDGANEAHYDPNFDWSRHLPPEVKLDRQEHDRILRLAFKFFTSWCLRIVPPLFLRDMHRALSVPRNQPPLRLSHYSPMLHNAILALGTAFSDDPAIRDLKSRMYFLEKAKTYQEDECSRPNLCVVNALSLIGSFHSSQGDPTLGYVVFGMSARVCQALGLGVDCSSWVQTGYITPEDQMDRSWVYWTTFCQDVCWSLFVGREYCFSTASKSVPIPFEEMDLPSGAHPDPEVRTFGATCRLLIITKSIMDVVNALDGPENRQMILDPRISEIDLALHEWESKLSDELKNSSRMRQNPSPNLIQIHLTYEWSFILLHRPFFRRRSARSVIRENTIEHAKICQRAADSTMILLDLWKQHYSFRYAPITLIQTIFATGTIWLLSALQAIEGVRIANEQLRQAMRKTMLCIEYLKEIGTSWPCATSIATILRNWMQATKPKIRQRTAVISPFSSVILPPKANAQGSSQASDASGSEKTPGKRKSKNAQGAARSRKRQRSCGGAEEPPSTLQRVESRTSLVPPPAPVLITSGDDGAAIAPLPAIARSPLLAQVSQLPTPPAATSPRFSQSAKLERPSPQPPHGHSPYGHSSPLPVDSSLPHSRPSPSRSIQTQPSQTFVHVSPQPKPWATLPEAGGDTPMIDAFPPGSTPEQPQSQGSSQSQSQEPSPPAPSDPNPLPASSSSPGQPLDASFNLEVNRNALAKTYSSTFAPLLLNYQFWAPGAFNLSPQSPLPHAPAPGGNNASGGTPATPADAAGLVDRSMSPISFQLAMLNGQRLGEAPFVPLSVAFPDGAERDNDLDLGQDGENMTSLNELGFEFINRQMLGEGVGVSANWSAASGGDMDMDMEGRGRDGWEDLAGDVSREEECVREEEFVNWFGVSEN